jgi:tRNA (guanosine-2'-O-)-methyltransferase
MGAERFQRIRAVVDRRQPDLTVLMEHVHKPHNLSAIVRNCDAVGIFEVHAVTSDEGLRLHHDTSAGTAKWVRVRLHEAAPSAMRFLRERGFRIVAADPGSGAADFRDVDYTRPTALLLGTELTGITETSLEEADERIRIPMKGMARSLNVSVATALVLYEAYRQREGAGFYDVSRLDSALRERLLFEGMYPKLARRLRANGTDYPEMDERGAIRG